MTGCGPQSNGAEAPRESHLWQRLPWPEVGHLWEAPNGRTAVVLSVTEDVAERHPRVLHITFETLTAEGPAA